MDKDNKHPYAGLTVFFGTLHGKERAVRPALRGLGMDCRPVPIDTDRFGTFSGEVERRGSILETLREKTRAVFESVPEARLVLASEGSFGPHPVFGLIPSDHEALLLTDRQSQELLVDLVSDSPRSGSIEISPPPSLRDLECAVACLGFPEHALVVRARGSGAPIRKGLRNLLDLQTAVFECASISPDSTAVVENDLRAHMNPTRMRVIESLAEKMVERISSLCPKCHAVGFWPQQRVKGLPCNACHAPTPVLKGHDWGCGICSWMEFRSSPGQQGFADPKHCDLCNP